MAKISSYTTATPVAADKLLGTDVSDTGNDAGGETVNFLVDDLMTLFLASVPAAPSTPSGAVMAFAMNSAPTDWLECNGAAVSRTTYSDLFTAIGTTFGVGDGSTTFNLPDLRGEFVRGWDNSRGVDSGRAFGSAQTDEFEAHTHTYTRTNTALTDASSSGSAESEPTGTSTVATSSAGGASETRPRNIALMYCIKT